MKVGNEVSWYLGQENFANHERQTKEIGSQNNRNISNQIKIQGFRIRTD